jgi:PAS domain S-box-containing protein
MVKRDSSESADSRHPMTDADSVVALVDAIASDPTVDALAASEARYRLGTDATQLGTWSWEVESDIATFDDRVRDLLGLGGENMRSRASILETRIHPDDRERVSAALRRAADPAGDGRFQGDYRIRLEDGTERCAMAFGRMHFAGDGETRRPVRLIGTVVDITERRLSEARQRLLARLGADLLVAADERVALQQLADAAVTDLADWAIVDVIDAGDTARRVAMAHADPAKLEVMDELARRYPPDPSRPTLGRQALATGRPQLFAQIDEAMLGAIAQDAEQARLGLAMGFRSAIAVPLQTRTGPFGIAAFGSGRRSFGAEDLAVAEEIGRRASLAVENARLVAAAKLAQAEAERSASRTARLQTLSAALSAALTPNDVATAAVREAIAAAGADAGLLVLISPDGTSLDLVESRGYDERQLERWRRFPADTEVPLAEAVRTGEMIIVPTEQERAARYAAIRTSDAATYPASISIPLIAEGRSFGALGLSFRVLEAVTPDDRNLLLAIARQCAQAVRRAVLFDAEGVARAAAEEAGRQLKFLADASAALASLDYESTLRRVAQLAVPSFADIVIIDLLGDDGEMHRVAVAHADPAKLALLEETARYYPGASHKWHPFREPLRTRQPVLVEDVDDAFLARLTRTPEHLALVRALEPTSLILAPLAARGHTLGVMAFASAGSGRRYGASDVALAREVGQRAGVAVDNARLYRESEVARREAEAASRAKGQFLAVMSHELRTPLNAILGYSELVEMGVHGPVTDAQREAMLRIRRSGQHLLSLVNNVLNLERSEVNELEAEFSTLLVTQLFEDADALTRPQAEAKGITLTVNAPPADVAVLGEREKAGQVLVNLLSNAVKFTPSGGTIVLRCTVDDDTVSLDVTDSGQGIPAESLERIFEPFVQLDSGLTRKAEGAGLGLAISRRLARLMGGDLTVTSDVGSGSTFSFTLVRVV